jgi:phosphatidylglycerol---prolipoprotein diacylglyceryl transferase
VHPLLFHLGSVAIPTYGVLTALALLAALGTSTLAARPLRLPADKLWNLGLLAILTALLAGRLLFVLGHPSLFRKVPFWLLGLVTLPSIGFALGGAAVGALAAMLYALSEGLPLLKTADALAPAAALAFCLNRTGAFCAGSAWGTPTRLPWGVTYRSVVAWLWYGVPLGVRLHPVQLYDAAASLAIFILLIVIVQRRGAREPGGEVAGAWLFLYGVARFFLEFLRGDPAREPLLRGAVTLAQVLGIAGVFLGAALWLRKGAPEEHATAQPS